MILNENTLNLRQQAFVDNYVMTGNATKSAIAAGYSPKAAYSQGQRLLKNGFVWKAISTRMEEIKDDRIAETKEILRYITSVMRGEQSDTVVMNIGRGNGITTAEKISTKVSEKDKLKAAEMLAKINGLFKQELEFSSALPIVICDDI